MIEQHKESKITPATHVLLWSGKTILLLRRFNTGFADGQYDTIAGHVEKGESFSTAARREALEEAGISISLNELRAAHIMNIQTKDGGRIHVFFSAHKWENEPYIAEPSKCDRMVWATLDNLPENILPYVAQAIAHIQRGQIYSELDISK